MPELAIRGITEFGEEQKVSPSKLFTLWVREQTSASRSESWQWKAMNNLKLNHYRTEDNENYQQTTQCITKTFNPVALMFSLVFHVTDNLMLLQEKSNEHWEVYQNVPDSTLCVYVCWNFEVSFLKRHCGPQYQWCLEPRYLGLRVKRSGNTKKGHESLEPN